MADLPRISIVTASFNQAAYLGETMESILGQGYPKLEYIVIDGGSTDGSVEIIKRYESRLAYWVSEADRGQSHAIMKGFGRATGELFAWVNSDDVLFPGCLQRVAEHYLRKNRPSIVHSNIAYLDSQGRVTRFIRVPRQSRCLFFHGVWYGAAPSIFFRSDLFRAVGGLNERYYQAMDLDLWMRLVAGGAVMTHIPAYLGGFRWHEASKSFGSFRRGVPKEHPEVVEIFARNFSHWRIQTRFLWRGAYKLYRLFNLNYWSAYRDLRRLRGPKHWKQVFGESMRDGDRMLSPCLWQRT
jgi:glycosyltransferase involved in cell wall biosynthesis